ncbi:MULTISPECIES: HAD-IIA family hydrolase [unclassified Mesorhizobium]|uniref:HAD-IIA family hydrolase n=1 Tax=unclassified Mesorhizobium TaxID=325217 RepID=UPI000F756584|nr:MULTISPECIES: HAD-IIA family hydrolase [unclassified Mesorhizobium]AZO05137.1 HAD-IIA family hydrolase [Mesorhizobium sp. M2A.F.Ca.ET.043.02.1.1]RWB42896.1 MAG: HAD-IIA family hydrolase [Mesorhizobium sp.]RWB64899.1 MAG: HAD-IIA family hydrolase [Mesorhizobium sp.]RWB88141.1 MAG: HAD-IIA family hydrolase [Mesorhizobium sp.]RWD77323.1 MAG: HAD-IIA family hydrolase [Mesorhizobium sp.]
MEIAYLLDMDGVLVRGGTPIEGSADFVGALVESMRAFQIFTNNSRYTPEDHVHRLRMMGFPVEPHHIYTSALATARFVTEQLPGASVYGIGDQGLMSALQAVGCRFTVFSPDFVVLGDADSYHYEEIVTGARLLSAGARFIATSPDPSVPAEKGVHPACGAVAALIAEATGMKPYFIGKPNSFMTKCALEKMGVRAEQTVLVGDRMDTDVLAALQSGMRSALVLTGATAKADVARFPFRPDVIVDRLADLADHSWA